MARRAGARCCRRLEQRLAGTQGFAREEVRSIRLYSQGLGPLHRGFSIAPWVARWGGVFLSARIWRSTESCRCGDAALSVRGVRARWSPTIETTAARQPGRATERPAGLVIATAGARIRASADRGFTAAVRLRARAATDGRRAALRLVIGVELSAHAPLRQLVLTSRRVRPRARVRLRPGNGHSQSFSSCGRDSATLLDLNKARVGRYAYAYRWHKRRRLETLDKNRRYVSHVPPDTGSVTAARPVRKIKRRNSAVTLFGPMSNLFRRIFPMASFVNVRRDL